LSKDILGIYEIKKENMNINDILQLDFDKAISALTPSDARTPIEYKKEFDRDQTSLTPPSITRSNSIINRPNKTIGTGETRKIVKTAKLIFNFQKKIVNTCVSFLFGSPLTISASEESEAFQYFRKTWRGLKLDYVLKSLARTVMTETKAAIIFYPVLNVETNESELKLKLLQSNDGEFYPHFDGMGSMDAFMWRTVILDTEGKERQSVRIYTADKTIVGTKYETWQIETLPNLFTKIPVVYVDQPFPEWNDVTSLIDEFEYRISRFADTNDYFSEPMVVIKGEVESAPSKEEVGKMVFIPGVQNGDKKEFGSVDYLTWDQTPEAIKLELDLLKNSIYSLSSTPDISFDNVKGMSNLSGIAIKMMFMDAMMKAKDKEETFGPAVERIISIIRTGISNITQIKYKTALETTEINFQFNSILPDNISETIASLVTATGGKPVMSQQTAVGFNPFVTNSGSEILNLETENTQDATTNIASSFV
jgi:hypothetical protein